MTVETAAISILEFVEQRTALLQALSEALSAAGASVTSFDLDGLEARIAQQQQLCAKIAGLDRQVNAVQKRILLAGSSSSPALQQATVRLREAHSRVRFLNEQHQLLLHRSRRTVNALMRCYQTFAADVYENPARQAPHGRAAGEMA